jgi:hypothetical protein
VRHENQNNCPKRTEIKTIQGNNAGNQNNYIRKIKTIVRRKRSNLKQFPGIMGKIETIA